MLDDAMTSPTIAVVNVLGLHFALSRAAFS